MSHDTFISHASEDRGVAIAIRAALAATGITCWMAPDDIHPGDEWGAAITTAIKGSRALILVFSAHANASKQVSREVERAVHLGIPMVTFHIEPIDPTSSLEHFISLVHWLEASNPPQKGDLDRLAQAVRGCLDAKEKPVSPCSTKSMQAEQAASAPRMALLYKRHVATDEAVSKWLESALAARGYKVFVDRNLGGGVEWAKELDRRIRESDAVIPLLSAASVQSEMLAGELQIAHDEAEKRHGKPRILPVRLNFEGELPVRDGRRPQSAAISSSGRIRRTIRRLLAELVIALEKPSGPAASSPPPTGVLPLDSRYYVERPVDQEMQAALGRQDSVIRIRGARQVGKTSLLARGLEQARAAGTRVVMTDFQQLNASDLASVETLFRRWGRGSPTS